MGGAFEDIRNFSKKSLKVPKKLNGVPFSQKCLPVSRFSFSTLLKYPETALSKGSRANWNPNQSPRARGSKLVDLTLGTSGSEMGCTGSSPRGSSWNRGWNTAPRVELPVNTQKKRRSRNLRVEFGNQWSEGYSTTKIIR